MERRIYSEDVEDIRAREYPQLKDVTYLDHGGTTPYAHSLVERFAKDLQSGLFGNPHSASPSSQLSTTRVEKIRTRVLQFFKADPQHFDLIFVQNATAAIKLVTEAFRELPSPGFWYGYHRDAHNSLVGIRELVTDGRDNSKCFESDADVESWIKDPSQIRKCLGGRAGLFAYPAQSNMNGHRTPSNWTGRIRSSLSPGQKLYTFLDAAAYVTTAQLDLSDHMNAPDFTALSFYKIFGFPDLGALIVRKESGNILRRRRYFGGGTVDMVTVMRTPWHAKKDEELHEQLEDGTLPFHHILALDSALNVHEELYGSMDNISKHTSILAADLYKRLRALRHFNGLRVCDIYKDSNSQYGNSKTQGPVLAFNLRNSHGAWIGKSHVEKLAIVRGIHLRTGGVCNPGGIATFCKLEHWEMRRNFSEGMRCGDNLDVLGGKPTGIVRIGLGAMTNQQDINTFINFIQNLFVENELIEQPSNYPSDVTATEAESTIESLHVFPVLGCSGWKVPHNNNWPINERGLAWDQEWCVVLQGDTNPLNPLHHPRLTLINTDLNIETGILKLSAPKDTSDNTAEPEYRDAEISTWDSPPKTEQTKASSDYLPADRYEGEEIAKFCTEVLRVPCTLARFRDYRRVAKDHPNRPSRPLSLRERSFTVAALSQENVIGNLTLSGSLKWQSHRYVQIGQHFFESFDTTDSTQSSKIWHLVYIRNMSNRSPAAQNPMIRAGDHIRTYSSITSHQTPALRNCIASSSAGDHVCPVWFCHKAFGLESELLTHLKDHKKNTYRPSSRAKPSGQDVKVMAVEVPVTYRNYLEVQNHLPVPRTVVRAHSPSRRKSWRQRLAVVLPGSFNSQRYATI